MTKRIVGSPRNKPKTCELYFRNIPTELKNQFKAFCSRRGKSMTEEIQRMMRDCIDMEKAANA